MKDKYHSLLFEYLIALSVLCFSIIISADIYASGDGRITVKFKNAYGQGCNIPDLKIEPGQTLTLPNAPEDTAIKAVIYGAPHWKPVKGQYNNYLKSSANLSYEDVSRLCSAYGNNNVLTLYSTKALSLAYYTNDGSKKLWQLYYYEGSNATLRNTPYEPNKAYKGWTKTKNGTKVTLQFKQKYRIEENTNLYLVTYTRVRFYKINGVLDNTCFYERGSSITLPPVPAAANYRSLGWSTDKNAASASYSSGKTVTVKNNIDFYGIYKIKPYYVKFCDNNGACTTSAYKKICLYASSGETITLPNPPALANYISLGWAYKAKETEAKVKAGAKVKITKSVTYYAVYRKARTFTITYVDQNGSTSNEFSSMNKNIKEGTVFTLPAIPAKIGYTAVCWKINVNGTATSYNAGTKIKAAQNYRFSAYYKRNADAQLILHYNNGQNYKAINIPYGTSFRLPPMDNPQGYTFIGWGTKPNMLVSPSQSQTFYQVGTWMTINSASDLYAVFAKRSNEPNLTEDQLAGSVSPDVSAYKKIIFVGDSRTNRIRETLTKQKIDFSKKNVSFIAKEGSGIVWLKEEAYPALIDMINDTDSNDSRPIAVIFNHGVNDMSSSQEYISYYNSIASALKSKNCRLFFMSVNPINSIRQEKTGVRVRYEYEVRDFNAKVKKGVEGNYTYIDTYSWLLKTGYGTDGGHGTDTGIDDGLHFTTATSKRIYLRCLECLAGKVKCSYW